MFDGKDNAVIINCKSASFVQAMKVLNTQIVKQRRYECDHYIALVVMQAAVVFVGRSLKQCFRLSLFLLMCLQPCDVNQ
jgi:hypothetical protein